MTGRTGVKINAFIAIGGTNMKEEDVRIVKLALDMYDDFFNQLTTALFNTKKNWEWAQFSPQHGACQYNQGRIDAFKEFLERLEKERDLAKQEYQNVVDFGHFAKVHKDIKFHKNLEVDSLLPDEKYRGKPLEYAKIQRLKARIADLLEGYAVEGFKTGVRYMKMRFLDEKWNGRATKFDRKELEKHLTTPYEEF